MSTEHVWILDRYVNGSKPYAYMSAQLHCARCGEERIAVGVTGVPENRIHEILNACSVRNCAGAPPADTLRAARTETIQSLANLQKTAKDLEVACSSMIIDNNPTTLANLDAVLKKKQDEIFRLEATVKNHAEEISILTRELKEAEDKNAALARDCDRALVRADGLESNLETLRTDLANAQRDAARFSTDAAHARIELERYKRGHESQEDIIESQKRAHTRAIETITKLESDKSETDRMIANLALEVGKLTAERDKYREGYELEGNVRADACKKYEDLRAEFEQRVEKEAQYRVENRPPLYMNSLRDLIHGWAKRKGWWENPDRNIGELLMLVTTEIAEAMEDYRTGKMKTYLQIDSTPPMKPCGFPSEIADTFIRLLDLCGALDIDVDKEIDDKMKYNESREHRHGGLKA